jgi:hypothetical protein
VISGAAFCPQPPVLVPDLAGAAAPELDDLRAACRAAITQVAAAGHQLVLLGAGPSSKLHSPLARGTLAGFGLSGEIHLGAPTCGGALELPPSLTVGAWLTRDVLGPRSGALAVSVGPDFGRTPAAVELLRMAEESDITLLVMGDGSARRSIAAPGHLDDRAATFDAEVVTALAAGDGEALARLDLELGAELMATGVPAWRAAGSLLTGTRYRASLLADSARYGVGYFVASWLQDD